MTVLSLPVIVSSLKSSFESLSRKFFISFASFFFFWLYSLAKFQPWKNSTTRFLHAHIVATKNYWRKPPNLLSYLSFNLGVWNWQCHFLVLRKDYFLFAFSDHFKFLYSTFYMDTFFFFLAMFCSLWNFKYRVLTAG